MSLEQISESLRTMSSLVGGIDKDTELNYTQSGEIERINQTIKAFNTFIQQNPNAIHPQDAQLLHGICQQVYESCMTIGAQSDVNSVRVLMAQSGNELLQFSTGLQNCMRQGVMTVGAPSGPSVVNAAASFLGAAARGGAGLTAATLSKTVSAGKFLAGGVSTLAGKTSGLADANYREVGILGNETYHHVKENVSDALYSLDTKLGEGVVSIHEGLKEYFRANGGGNKTLSDQVEVSTGELVPVSKMSDFISRQQETEYIDALEDLTSEFSEVDSKGYSFDDASNEEHLALGVKKISDSAEKINELAESLPDESSKKFKDFERFISDCFENSDLAKNAESSESKIAEAFRKVFEKIKSTFSRVVGHKTDDPSHGMVSS